MHIVLISGSHRSTSESGRIAHYMAARLETLGSDVETSVLNLADQPLPLWDDGMWSGSGPAYDAWQKVSPQLQKADAFVVIAAEWNGTAPAALKNLFHYTSTAEMGHKAGLLVGVSASMNGVYPIVEMHEAGKNCRICYIPEHLIIRDVAAVLNDDVQEAFVKQDSYIRERTDYALEVLLEYSKALTAVRSSGKLQTEKFPFGM